MTIFAINDVGQISGYYVDASGAFHGFVETQKQFHTIDVPGAAVTFHKEQNGVKSRWPRSFFLSSQRMLQNDS
jgi:hypothetical protein